MTFLKLDLEPVNNLTELAALIRSVDNSEDTEAGFDMSSAHFIIGGSDHPCGTAACIGGWLFEANKHQRREAFEDALIAIHPGLSYKEAEDLCYGFPDENVTQEQAARAIEILRDTGKCDWERAMIEGAE